MRATPYRVLLLIAMLALALFAAGCGGDDDDEEGSGAATATSEEGASGGTLVFGTSADPVVLDGALVSDGESLRVIDQIFETLVSLKPGTTELEPGLAKSWEISDDGLTYTFTLQEGVTFHDGEPFNAEAVCVNFDRWYNFEGSFQNPSASYYWQTVFGGFAETDPESGAPAESFFESCTAVDEGTVEIKLTTPSSAILGALSLSNVLDREPEGARGVRRRRGHGRRRGRVPPDRDVRHRAPDRHRAVHVRVVDARRPPHDRPLRRLLGREGQARQGHLPPDPGQRGAPPGAPDGRDPGLRPRRAAGHRDDRGRRPTCRSSTARRSTSATSGSTRRSRRSTTSKVRQAIAHGLNRQEVVDNFYGGRGEVATQFMPPEVIGYADDVTEYEFDPEKSKQLLQEAGLTLPVPIEFWYPSDVSRPYMPDPKRNFEAFRRAWSSPGSR